MQSRWFNMAVVLLWLATMGWLLVEKVLPPLMIGDPPSYGKIIEAQRDAPPVGWRMLLNDQPLGWALSDSTLQPSGLTEIHSRVHFEKFPLEELLPTWLRSLVKMMHRSANRLEMDARSVLVIDALGHLLRFDSSVRVDPWSEIINIRGTVDGRQLELIVRSGEASFVNETYLPSNELLTDALSPQTILPDLRDGQTWTMPVYSPIWPSKNPLEIVRAKVEGTESIVWDGEPRQCWLVVYRSDPGSGTDANRAPRGKLWVRRDGPVLRQDISMFDSTIRFDRLPDKDAVQLAKDAGPQWWNMEVEKTPWQDGRPPFRMRNRDRFLEDIPRIGIERFSKIPPNPATNGIDADFQNPPGGAMPDQLSPHGIAPHPQDAADD